MAVQTQNTDEAMGRVFKKLRIQQAKNVIAEAGKRVMKNLEDYQSNYVLITILLFFYCVLVDVSTIY